MEDVYNYLLNKCGLKDSETVVVAVSAGPDSMALLHLLIRVRQKLNLNIVVAHVNHNVRVKESEQERIDLEKYCLENDVTFEYMKIENYGEDNFHNEARSIRYNYFDKMCKKYNSKYLFTAHHGDDLIETILMRIVRGSTLKGYSGFSRVAYRGDYKIIRPLITVTKDEIIKYDKENDIPYALDKSNEKDVYTRNRYRKYVLPFLKNEEVNVHHKFLKFSETLLEYNNYIDKQISDVIVKVFKNGILNISSFLELDHLIQNKIIYNILEQIYGDELIIISDAHVKLLYDLIKSRRANSFIHLPNNVKAVKSYNKLSFSFDADIMNDTYEIEICDNISLPNNMVIDKVDSCDWTNNYCTRLSSKDVKLPLYVRTRRAGDRMFVKGMEGRKKVNNIFIEDKISINDRQLWPIVCDAEDNIVWVPGLKKSQFDKDKNEVYDIILRYY